MANVVSLFIVSSMISLSILIRTKLENMDIDKDYHVRILISKKK